MRNDFYKLTPKVSSKNDCTAIYTEPSHGSPDAAVLSDIQERQKNFLSECCAEKEPGPERYTWLINKTEFTYRWRYVYAGESAAAILQTIADESALFFDHDLSAKNRFLNKRAAPNERISEEMYTAYRDGVLDGFYRELKARRGRRFAQKSRNAAKRLMDQIEAERRRAKRSLVQWLYSDAHMKVPRRNYAELKKRYAKEDPKGREPTPAQIRTRIREEWDIYHEELLSDRILQQEYQRILGESKRYIHLIDDSDFRLTFLRHVLLPIVQRYKEWRLWKEYPLDGCDPLAHDIIGFTERMSRLQELQQCEKENALDLNEEPYCLPLRDPTQIVSRAHLSSCGATLLPFLDVILDFYRGMGRAEISEEDKANLAAYIRGIQTSVTECNAGEKLPIVLILCIARYKRQLFRPATNLKAFWEEQAEYTPYFGGSIAPSQQRLQYLRLLRRLCMWLALSEKATASNLNAFVCFFGWKKMSDKEIQQWRTLTQKYGYESIPAVGVSLRMYEYGMNCLPASYFDLSCRLIRPLKQEAFLELCRKNEAQLRSAYQMTVNAIRLFATQYISLWSKAWFYRVERYNTLKEEKEKAGDFSQLYKAIDLSKFRLFIDTAIPYKKTRSVQQPGEEWSSPIHGRVLSPPEIPAKRIVRQMYGRTDEERQELRLLFAELLTREYIRNQALKDLFKKADAICGTHTSAFFKLKNLQGGFAIRKNQQTTPSGKDDRVR